MYRDKEKEFIQKNKKSKLDFNWILNGNSLIPEYLDIVEKKVFRALYSLQIREQDGYCRDEDWYKEFFLRLRYNLEELYQGYGNTSSLEKETNDIIYFLLQEMISNIPIKDGWISFNHPDHPSVVTDKARIDKRKWGNWLVFDESYGEMDWLVKDEIRIYRNIIIKKGEITDIGFALQGKERDEEPLTDDKKMIAEEIIKKLEDKYEELKKKPKHYRMPYFDESFCYKIGDYKKGYEKYKILDLLDDFKKTLDF